MCCTYRVLLGTKSLDCNMMAWGSCTLTHFDRQFLFFSDSLKNDYTHSYITYRLANTFYTTITHNIIDLYGRIHSVIVCTQTAHGNMSCGEKCIKKPVLTGPLESDIVEVRDMSEKATENKVYLEYNLSFYYNAMGLAYMYTSKSRQ